MITKKKSVAAGLMMGFLMAFGGMAMADGEDSTGGEKLTEQYVPQKSEYEVCMNYCISENWGFIYCNGDSACGNKSKVVPPKPAK